MVLWPPELATNSTSLLSTLLLSWKIQFVFFTYLRNIQYPRDVILLSFAHCFHYFSLLHSENDSAFNVHLLIRHTLSNLFSIRFSFGCDGIISEQRALNYTFACHKLRHTKKPNWKNRMMNDKISITIELGIYTCFTWMVSLCMAFQCRVNRQTHIQK